MSRNRSTCRPSWPACRPACWSSSRRWPAFLVDAAKLDGAWQVIVLIRLGAASLTAGVLTAGIELLASSL